MWVKQGFHPRRSSKVKYSGIRLGRERIKRWWRKTNSDMEGFSLIMYMPSVARRGHELPRGGVTGGYELP